MKQGKIDILKFETDGKHILEQQKQLLGKSAAIYSISARLISYD